MRRYLVRLDVSIIAWLFFYVNTLCMGAANALVRLHARIQKVLSEGSNSDNGVIFLGDEGREDPNTTKRGPLSARQQNAI